MDTLPVRSILNGDRAGARLLLWFAVMSSLFSLLFLAGPAFAQTSQYSVAYRYDSAGRQVGAISPDPDGDGVGNARPAVRTVYDAVGLVVRVESGVLATWQAPNVAPNAWTGFTIQGTEHRQYNTLGQLVRTWVVGDNGQIASVVEANYDREGRARCSAVRMNSDLWTTPRDACSLSTTTTEPHGVDRITKNIYDSDGRLRQVRRAVGVGGGEITEAGVEIAEATYEYSPNGQMTTVIDANGNRAQLQYDGHDRLNRWVFPSTTRPSAFNASTFTSAIATAGQLNQNDDELYSYDNNGNRTSLTKRDNTVLAFTYDALNQVRSRTVQNPRDNLPDDHERSVHYNYDLRGLQTAVRFDNASTGPGIINSYNGFGRLVSTQNTLLTDSPTLQYAYNPNGDRTQITHPDAQTFYYTLDNLGRLDGLSGATTIVDASYNSRGGLLGVARGGTTFNQSYGYDPVGRLTLLSHVKPGSSSSVVWTFAHNPASQIVTDTRDNDLYAWVPDAGDQNYVESYITNGLNQYSAISGTGLCYDLNGNLTSDGTNVFLYDNENRLVERRALGATNCATNSVDYSGALLAKLSYDPLGRLYRITDSTNVPTFFLNDGDALVMEYNAAGGILDRYVHGNNAGADDPLAWYPGGSVADSNLRTLYSDTRGSIVLVADNTGGVIHRNSYGTYGQQGANNGGRFQYTGQVYLEELGMYYYKARIYAPEIGRFLQTDPIGYEDQMNLYAYVGNDPINGVDPTGMQVATPDQWNAEVWTEAIGSVADWGKMVIADSIDFGEAIIEGDFEWALGGMPPTLGGAVIGSGMTSLTTARTVGQTASVTQRARQIHSVLDPIAQSRRTTAVLQTSSGRIVAGGGVDLIAAQRGALHAGETAARSPGAHAEVTALRQAAANGARPRSLGTSRPICAACAAEIRATGGRLTSPTSATWRSRIGAAWDRWGW